MDWLLTIQLTSEAIDNLVSVTELSQVVDVTSKLLSSIPQTPNSSQSPDQKLGILFLAAFYARAVLFLDLYNCVALNASNIKRHLMELNALDDDIAAKPMRRRQKRANHSREAREILFQWLFFHQEHPFPTENEKKLLITQTGLSETQLNDWFVNARRRVLRRPTAKAKKLWEQAERKWGRRSI